MASDLRCITRASAYRAPAARAASTAAVAASYSVMVHRVSRKGRGWAAWGVETREYPQVMADVIELLSDRCLGVFPNPRKATSFVTGTGITVPRAWEGAALMSDTTTSGERGVRSISDATDEVVTDPELSVSIPESVVPKIGGTPVIGRSPGQLAWMRLRRDRVAVTSAGVLALFAV